MSITKDQLLNTFQRNLNNVGCENQTKHINMLYEHSPAIISVTTFMLCKLKTIRREACKDDCFWSNLFSGACVKAVCSRLSERKHGVGCQGKPRGCDCPSQLWKILFSNLRTLKNHCKFCECSSIGQLKAMRNSGGLKTGLN